MIRLTLAQMRLNLGRLSAAGIAVALGSGFVTATLLTDGMLKGAMADSVSASFRGSDVVVTGPDLTAKQLAAVRALPQVEGADPVVDLQSAVLSGGGRSTVPDIAALPGTPGLRTVAARSGRLPARTGELAVTADLAKRLQLGIGSRATLTAQPPPDANGHYPAGHPSTVVVVGLIDSGTAFVPGPDAVADQGDVRHWATVAAQPDTFWQLHVRARPGVHQQQLQAAVAALPGWKDTSIRTAQDETQAKIKELTSGVDVLAAVVLGFAAVALFVAGLVIVNTFQVLVAQRARWLALLRCVGATRSQVRRSVLLEALLLGLVAASGGVLVAVGLTAVTPAVVSRLWNFALPGPSLGVLVLAGPVLLGAAVCLLAALTPARVATRVSPVAALRPVLPAGRRLRWRVLRMGLALALIALGGGLLVLGSTLSASAKSTSGLLPALAGGMISFLGVLLGAGMVIPALVSRIGGLAGRWGGASTRIAAANAGRNPRRTTNTATALLIGVTLVATMVTGAAIARATVNTRLDSHYPVDFEIGMDGGASGSASWGIGTALPPGARTSVSRVNGLAATAPVRSGWVTLSRAGTATPAGSTGTAGSATGTKGSGSTGSGTGGTTQVDVEAVDPGQARQVVKVPAQLDPLRPGVALLPRPLAHDLGIADGQTVRLLAGRRSLDLRVAVTDLHRRSLVLTPADQARVLPEAPVSALWMRLAPGADARTVLADLRDGLANGTGSRDAVPVFGQAAERASFDEAVHTILMIVMGLLAVAVVIAVIGVANTLSLSVIERTRESAMLRALGLTRRQLRGMLAVEGGLIAGIGALLGIGLGLVYGWFGVSSTIGGVWKPVLSLPGGQLVLLLAGAVLAGLAASVLPGRRAANTPPVAALAE